MSFLGISYSQIRLCIRGSYLKKLTGQRILLEGKQMTKESAWGRSGPGWASGRKSACEGQAKEKLLTRKIFFFVLNHPSGGGMKREPWEADPVSLLQLPRLQAPVNSTGTEGRRGSTSLQKEFS